MGKNNRRWHRVRLGDWEGFWCETDGHGALCTAEQWAQSQDSFGYVFPDGWIKRYGRRIGHCRDLQILEKCVNPPPIAISPDEHLGRSLSALREQLENPMAGRRGRGDESSPDYR